MLHTPNSLGYKAFRCLLYLPGTERGLDKLLLIPSVHMGLLSDLASFRIISGKKTGWQLSESQLQEDN